MPAASGKQKTLMCIALSIKKGETPATYSKKAASMAEKMSVEQLEEYCQSKVKK